MTNTIRTQNTLHRNTAVFGESAAASSAPDHLLELWCVHVPAVRCPGDVGEWAETFSLSLDDVADGCRIAGEDLLFATPQT